MKVSVVMTTYNGSEFIIEQLNSILNQTRKPDDVYIFDDNSSDDTVKIISKYMDSNNIENWHLYINNHAKGWKKNFMDAIYFVNTDLIFTCDQDDVWMPNKLEEMEKIMNGNHNIELLTSNFIAFYDNGKKKVEPYRSNGKVEQIKIKSKNFVTRYPGCTYCIRRSLIEKSKGLWKEDQAHDAFFYNLALLYGTLYMYRQPLIKWRRHKSSTTTMDGEKNRCYKIRKREITEDSLSLINKENFIKSRNIEYYSRTKKVFKNCKKYFELRLKFYESGNIFTFFRLLRYINYFPSYKQYPGDLYLVWIDRRKKV